MMRPLLPLALGLLALAPAARAQGCNGKQGWHLDIPAQIEIGSVVDVDFTGPANEMALLMVSVGQGPVKSGYGTICLDFPLLAQVMLGLDAAGKALLQVDIPCDPALVDVTVYSQFITCRPNKGISNQVASTFIDALHAGDLCTYTQGGWGADCNGGNPGCLLETWFPTLFPNGLAIGDPDGVFDNDGVFAARWDSAKAINLFLPIGGSPGPLSFDAVDPTTLPACVFAGQLVAAKLNCAFDDAGVFDEGKCRDDLKLCDLVFVAGVHQKLIGWTVRDLIDLADQAIGCGLGGSPFDIDGDQQGDVTWSDLNDALDAFNRNFDDCSSNLGYLGLE